ncbi:MAG: hypothetical protein QM214_03140 [Bacillota bacterium]|nr:hypothetical protein [Bacillota bacterium]
MEKSKAVSVQYLGYGVFCGGDYRYRIPLYSYRAVFGAIVFVLMQGLE